ncbi:MULTISPECIES: nucleotide exchange factor GrpE [Caulobacter]|jgi:molecular chaperone GrpE|uniref:Protein GrpE n=1 Tax=Caulobacter rhizosphaerae TaxID=2010972 RepID=A0ABU1N174_9CAUL|nr:MULTISPECIES: nucleotide exchange factor GrpE [Caulobacter]KQZ29358.1 molecular chaperone GrpE [Caulobacter sp. Root1472]MDR6532163.1 molecular chaperone GrpE [Caulobacter rhizosphaerae]GGL21365.1 protein GrpE [Caulobacter rhizosphaerae]
MTDEQTPAEDVAFDTDQASWEDASQEIEALKLEVAALKDQALRYAADAENTKRRAEREMNDARAYAIQKFARDLLGVADNLSRATAHSPRDSQDAAVTNFIIGVEMTEKELLGAFERNGLKKIDPAKGEKFDPHLHQAVMEQPSDEVSAGGVIQVLQAGYELMGRLVRPAMVAVAAKGSKGPDAPAEPTAGAANPYAATGDTSGEAFDTKA